MTSHRQVHQPAGDNLATTLRAHALTPGCRNVITTTHLRLIRQARAAGMRIDEIAALLGVAVTTVSKYSSDRAQAKFAEYQRQRPMSAQEREVRRRRAYARWMAMKDAAMEGRAGC